MVSRVSVPTEIAKPDVVAAFGQRKSQITIVVIVHIATDTVYHPAGTRVREAVLKQDWRFIWCVVVRIYLVKRENLKL